MRSQLLAIDRRLSMLLLLFVAIPLNLSQGLCRATDATEKKWVFSLPEWADRVFVWRRDGLWGIEQPKVVSIGTSSAGIPTLGLVHSGYTAEDPCGKNAILTGTLKATNKPLSSDEKARLAKIGIKFGTQISLPVGSDWWLDVSLPLDPGEELRLRKELKLPRKMTATELEQPFSIRWEGIQGKKLYEWLTSEDGLKLVLRPDNASRELTALWQMGRSAKPDDAKLKEWWERNAGSSQTLEWTEGVEPLIDSVVTAGCLKSENGVTLIPETAGPEVAVLTERVAKILSHPHIQPIRMSKSDFFRVDWSTRVDTYQLKAQIPSLPSLSPGVVLIGSPDLVKDLSGTGVGLKALLRDAN
jgi:hypothetical protein